MFSESEVLVQRTINKMHTNEKMKTTLIELNRVDMGGKQFVSGCLWEEELSIYLNLLPVSLS